jgi:hypothetical protein
VCIREAQVHMNSFLRITAFLATGLAAIAGSKIAPDLPQSNPNRNEMLKYPARTLAGLFLPQI